MRRALLLCATVTLGLACVTSTLDGPRLAQYDVRIRSDYPERLVLYWLKGGTRLGTRLGTLASINAFGTATARIPDDLRGSHLRILVCRGRWTPTTHCTVARGAVQYSEHGTLVTVFATARLAAMVNG